jgi:hypothetical protein
MSFRLCTLPSNWARTSGCWVLRRRQHRSRVCEWCWPAILSGCVRRSPRRSCARLAGRRRSAFLLRSRPRCLLAAPRFGGEGDRQRRRRLQFDRDQSSRQTAQDRCGRCDEAREPVVPVPRGRTQGLERGERSERCRRGSPATAPRSEGRAAAEDGMQQSHQGTLGLAWPDGRGEREVSYEIGGAAGLVGFGGPGGIAGADLAGARGVGSAASAGA